MVCICWWPLPSSSHFSSLLPSPGGKLNCPQWLHSAVYRTYFTSAEQGIIVGQSWLSANLGFGSVSVCVSGFTQCTNQSNKFQHFHAELPYRGIYKNLRNTSFMHTSVIVCCCIIGLCGMSNLYTTQWSILVISSILNYTSVLNAYLTNESLQACKTASKHSSQAVVYITPTRMTLA